MVPLTILGGGAAGLSAAYYARRAGIAFRLFEKSDTLGGLCRTFECGPHLYDSGAHRFHDRDPETTKDLRGLLEDRLDVVTAPSKVYLGGRWLDFPPTPLNALFASGPTRAFRVAAELLQTRLRKRPIRNFADFAIQNFGKTLAQDFLLNYSEKVWGLPAEELSCKIATRRLTGMTLSTLLVEFLRRSQKTAHLDGQFLYPRLGYGEITARMAALLPRQAISTGRQVNGLDCSKNRIRQVRFADGSSWPITGQVVSTLPLTVLVRSLGTRLPPQAHQAAAELRFRHVRLIFLRLLKPRVSTNASVYLPDPSLCISRVYEPKNRSSAMAPKDETSLVAEVPCSSQDGLWNLAPDELCRKVEKQLREVGLLRKARVLQWRHHRLANAYPVYSVGFEDRLKTVVRSLEPFENLHILGRNGLFWYSHLHDQMRLGREYVKSLVEMGNGALRGGRRRSKKGPAG